MAAVPAIESVATLAPDVFRTRYLDASTPVVIRGAASDWPALELWTRAHLAATRTENDVPVDVYETGNYFEIGGAFGHRKRIHLPFREYLEVAAAHRGSRVYAPDLELSRYFPELSRDVRRPPLLPGEARPRFYLFAGHDAVTAGHFHPFTHALTCQIVGRKRFFLYPPEAGPNLYPNPWFSPAFHWSRVDFLRPDYDRFPKLEAVRALECELEPGDALFIPVHFWHWTQGVDFSASVLVSWEADVKSWHFPVPGYSALFARAVWPSENFVRRLASRAKRSGDSLRSMWKAVR